MIESILAIIATVGSPAASPTPCVDVVSAMVVADEIAATDTLPSLDGTLSLPEHKSAMANYYMAGSFRRLLTERQDMGAITVDDAICEVGY